MPSPSSLETLQSALARIPDPDRGGNILQSGAVRELRIENGTARFLLTLVQAKGPAAAATLAAAERAAMAVEGVSAVDAKIVQAAPQAAGLPPKRPIPGTKRVIAVSSGKGGVGKSTVCVNLAAAMKLGGAHVGILDGDIYGPNIPLMLGVSGKPEGSADKLFPFVAHGMQMMSMGLLVPEDQPMIWRGPMLNKAVQQFMFQVDWHDLDWLFVDLPPGTGDVQLTLTQNTEIDGAVIVTTPQDVAVLDVKKAIRMFEKIDVPVLGVVENMSWFQPPGHAERYALFGSGGGERVAREFGVPLLGQIPIGMGVREGGDRGAPITLTEPDGEISRAFRDAAERLKQRLSK
ncbi:MAG: P-loop NTPase [Planctomycetota bacterium]